MARRRNIPPDRDALAFFRDYAELLVAARRIAPLAARARRRLFGQDPAVILSHSSPNSVADFTHMLGGITWTAERIAQELESYAPSPSHALAGFALTLAPFDPNNGEPE